MSQQYCCRCVKSKNSKYEITFIFSLSGRLARLAALSGWLILSSRGSGSKNDSYKAVDKLMDHSDRSAGSGGLDKKGRSGGLIQKAEYEGTGEKLKFKLCQKATYILALEIKAPRLL